MSESMSRERLSTTIHDMYQPDAEAYPSTVRLACRTALDLYTEIDTLRAENAQLQQGKAYWQKVWEHRTADLKELEAENARLKGLIGTAPEGSHPDEWLPRDTTWHKERANWQKERDRLAARLQRVEGALRRFGNHDEECAALHGTPLHVPPPCDCGLVAALASPAPDTGQSGSVEVHTDGT